MSNIKLLIYENLRKNAFLSFDLRPAVWLFQTVQTSSKLYRPEVRIVKWKWKTKFKIKVCKPWFRWAGSCLLMRRRILRSKVRFWIIFISLVVIDTEHLFIFSSIVANTQNICSYLAQLLLYTQNIWSYLAQLLLIHRTFGHI